MQHVNQPRPQDEPRREAESAAGLGSGHDDKARERRLDEAAFWSALGCTGGLLILMIAWDATKDAWVTLTPGSVPQYVPPAWRLGLRALALLIACWIWLTALRDLREAERELAEGAEAEASVA